MFTRDHINTGVASIIHLERGLLLLLILLFGWFAYASRATQFEVFEQGLCIRSAGDGRTIPPHALKLAGARAASLLVSTPQPQAMLQALRRTARM